MRHTEKERKFDVAVVDEAGQMAEASSLILFGVSAPARNGLLQAPPCAMMHELRVQVRNLNCDMAHLHRLPCISWPRVRCAQHISFLSSIVTRRLAARLISQRM